MAAYFIQPRSICQTRYPKTENALKANNVRTQISSYLPGYSGMGEDKQRMLHVRGSRGNVSLGALRHGNAGRFTAGGRGTTALEVRHGACFLLAYLFTTRD